MSFTPVVYYYNNYYAECIESSIIVWELKLLQVLALICCKIKHFLAPIPPGLIILMEYTQLVVWDYVINGLSLALVHYEGLH